MLALLALGCDEQPETTAPITPSDDAFRLALRHQDSGILPNVELARIYHDVLERGAAVTPASRCTSVLPEYPHWFYLSLDDASAARWRRGDLVTGDLALDALVADYRVVTVDERTTSSGRFRVDLDVSGLIPGERSELEAQMVGVRTDRLVELFLATEPVLYGERAYWDIFGSDIELADSEEPESWEIIYTHGWSDCISGGCRYRRHWRTRVPKDPEQPAELLESYGDPDDPPEEFGPEWTEAVVAHLEEICGGL